MEPQDVKQQIAENLKNAHSVLVTTTNNPSVDEVASAIGLTQMLHSMNKHAASVISSNIPTALKFLNPDTIIEKSTDRLRDYVISFDKEKADKLRYKVEDDLVKIFITPYKTIISKDDFNFSQGDFNVDTVVVLGATKREELDEAVLQHGRVLHDSAVITINAGGEKAPSIGSMNWVDSGASSVSEMLVALSDQLGNGLLKDDSSQALLTGIVSATDRFSNKSTTPQVMTVAAQLMSAGANQQVIVENLNVKPEETVQPVASEESKVQKEVATTESEQEEKPDDGVMLNLQDSEPSSSPSVQLESDMQSKPEEPKAVKTPAPATPNLVTPTPSEGAGKPAPEAVNRPEAPKDTKSIEEKVEQKLKEAAESNKQSQTSSNTVKPNKQSDTEKAAKNALVQESYENKEKPEISSHKYLSDGSAGQANSQLLSHPEGDSENDPSKKDHTPTQGLFAAAKEEQKQANDQGHVNVHPGIPTLQSSKKKTINPPQHQQSPIEKELENTEKTQSKEATKQEQPKVEEKPPVTEPTTEKDQQTNTSEKEADASNDVESARKAVQAAIAESGTALPSAQQSTGAQNAQESGDIYIDHEGNLQKNDNEQ